jgi:taurine dioxygenase
MEITPIAGNIGATVTGVHLAQIDDASFDAVKQALWDHQVLVFRKQTMTVGAHKAVGERFGTLHSHPAYPGVEGHPEVLPIFNPGKDKVITEVWHSDVSCDAEPPSISILRAVKVPAHGGDTMWASQYTAMDRLSPGLRRMIDPLRAVHHNFDIEATHPVVRTHPETGRKALYVNHGFTRRFEDMTEEESRPLLDHLVAVGSSLDLTMRHRWQADDIVMWDNRCVMHYAIHDYGDATREMHRVTVRGERPH